MTRSIIVKGVQVRRISEKKLELTLPAGMDGRKLQAWKSENRDHAMALTDCDLQSDEGDTLQP